MRLRSLSEAQKICDEKKLGPLSSSEGSSGVLLFAAAASAAITAHVMHWCRRRCQQADAGVSGSTTAVGSSAVAPAAEAVAVLGQHLQPDAAPSHEALNTEDHEKKLAVMQGEIDGAVAMQRAAEQHVRELELRLDGVMAAKARGEIEMQQLQKAAEADVAAAKGQQQEAQAELESFQERATAIQRKVAATGSVVQQMAAEMVRVKEERDAALETLAAQGGTSEASDEQITAVRKQLRKVEGELRIAKENCRRMEDRMRGVLKERTEMVNTIKSHKEALTSPAVPS